MDNSFLRFINNFEQAKDLQNSKVTDFDYDMQIHLKPGESYSLITNCSSGIAFDNLYKAYIVNGDNIILLDISDRTIIEEFTNTESGLQQLKLELINITTDYFTDLCFLRLDHDIVDGESYWSNPFLISMYDIQETERFRFKNYKNIDGTNYEVANIFQSIRLKCRKQKINFLSTKEQYTTFIGLSYSSRIIKTKYYEYIFDMCNDFIYERLQYLLSHDIIYVGGVRITDKQTFDNADKISETVNLSQNKFKVAVNEFDIDDESYQVYEKQLLVAVTKIPEGDYNAIDFEIVTNSHKSLLIDFNLNIKSLDSLVIKLFKDGLFLANLSSSIVGSLMTIDISAITPDLGVYSVVINSETIYNDENPIETIYFNGFNFGEWIYSIVDENYNKSDYDENDYL